ncbi:unnamed protein product [Rotaria socialis]|nr:unnamed protein product [Rotaria socialis]
MTGEYVAFCVVVRNQHNDLPEWLQHHYFHHNIRRFYIMDDNSYPPHYLSQNFGIPREAITHRYLQNVTTAIQHGVYNICHEDYGTKHQWIALFDVDEFLEVRLPATLNTFLKKHENAGGVGVNWQIYGSSGHLTRPTAGVRKSYFKCISDESNPHNTHIKTISNTAYFLGMDGNPHTVLLNKGKTTVDEHGKPIPGNGPCRVPVTKDIILLHHYVLKSKEEYVEKMLRGSANRNKKDWNFWNHIEMYSNASCTSMTKYNP